MGPGAQWLNSGLLAVADNGSGTLDILNGGFVSNQVSWIELTTVLALSRSLAPVPPGRTRR